jgi:hypothetical protein
MFQLEDELFVEEGRDVMVGVVYQWLRGASTWSWSPACMAERRLDLALVTSMQWLRTIGSQ